MSRNIHSVSSDFTYLVLITPYNLLYCVPICIYYTVKVFFLFIMVERKPSVNLHSVRRLSSTVVSQTTKVFTFSTSLVGFYLLISVEMGKDVLIDSLT